MTSNVIAYFLNRQALNIKTKSRQLFYLNCWKTTKTESSIKYIYLPWEVLTVRKIHVRTSHRPVVTRVNSTTWRKHQIKFNPRKSLKATGGNDVKSEFHLKLVLPASTVHGEVNEFFSLFFSFSVLSLPFCTSFQHCYFMTTYQTKLATYLVGFLFNFVLSNTQHFFISFTIHWLLFRPPSWHSSLAEANMCLHMYSLLICLDALKAFLL